VPNGVDTDYFSPTPDVAPVVDRIVFLGPTYQVANRDAVEYLVAVIFPRVRARCSTASLHLIGDCPQPDKTRYNAQPGVACLGHVPDVRPHVAEAMCSIVPIRVGGGTRVKILDSCNGEGRRLHCCRCEGLETPLMARTSWCGTLQRYWPTRLSTCSAAAVSSAGLGRPEGRLLRRSTRGALWGESAAGVLANDDVMRADLPAWLNEVRRSDHSGRSCCCVMLVSLQHARQEP
jgi:hypothetical protein